MVSQSIFAAASGRTSHLWADLPLRVKGLIAAAIPLAALLAAAATWQIFLFADREAEARITRTAAAAGAARSALEHLLAWESALGEYTLNRGSERRARAAAAAQTLCGDFSSLEKIMGGERERLARLDRVRRMFQPDAMREDPPGAVVGTAIGIRSLRAELEGLRAAQEKSLARGRARAARLRRWRSAVLAGEAVLGFGGGTLAMLLFTSGVARAIERIGGNAARVAQRLPLPRGSGRRDELGRLERDLETLSASLSRGEEERDRFFTLSLDMLCVATLDGRFRRVNPAFIKTLGYAEADLLSSGILDFVHAADREATGARMRELAGGHPIVYFENRLCCADGAFRWMAWSMAPFLAEGLVYAVARDRTGQKLDEQALRQLNSRLECVLESITDGFFALDCTWRLTCVNPQAARLWMRPRGELLGRHLWEVFPEADGGPFHRMYAQAILTGAPAHLEEFHPPFNRWFEVHAYPSSEGLSVYFRDVTERRQSEDKIGRALKEKEVLLREVHHRVKNNLQVICSMLRLQAGRSNDEALSQVLRDCRERVMAMAMLHDQLHRAKDLSNINLGEYSRNLAASMFCSYGVNSAQIELRTEVEDIAVSFDTAIPCGLILHELLSNALRHAFPAGHKGRVWLILRAQPGGRIELTVSDDGRGFSETAAGAGTRSLGLRLVDLLGEQIDAVVERSSQAGTLCRLLFPAKKSKEI